MTTSGVRIFEDKKTDTGPLPVVAMGYSRYFCKESLNFTPIIVN